jgi:hypothetical protein
MVVVEVPSLLYLTDVDVIQHHLESNDLSLGLATRQCAGRGCWYFSSD